MSYFAHMIPRLNGSGVADEFERYASLVKKGVSGFIVFGGELEVLREHIGRLQGISPRPLFIAADLEQGLGQQVRGGTLFPPAMGIANASARTGRVDQSLLRRVFGVCAEEALYAGINTILAPVVDINTNPENPIIAARSFGNTKEDVATCAVMMIEECRQRGVLSCAKHFPGHGDTSVDSHMELPVLRKGLPQMEREELYPFRAAVKAGVDAVMLAHISVPAIDPSGLPMSVSANAVRYMRKVLGFNGLAMTDALNMGGLSALGENEAARMALEAGADILLHPTDPDAVTRYLEARGARGHAQRLESVREGLKRGSDSVPDFEANARFAREVAEAGINVTDARPLGQPSCIVVLTEAEGLSRGIIEHHLAEVFPGVRRIELTAARHGVADDVGDNALVVVFSTTSAWKGGTAHWLREALHNLSARAGLMVSLGNPFVLHGLAAPRVFAYWCSEEAERALVRRSSEFLLR